MRTRRQAKRQEESQSDVVSKGELGHDDADASCHGEGSLNSISEEAVGRLLKRANRRKLSGSYIGRNISESHHHASWECRDKNTELGKGKKKADEEILTTESSMLDHATGDAERTVLMKDKLSEKNIQNDASEVDWEEGMIRGDAYEFGKEVHIEFTESTSSAQQRPRRFSVEDKEIAESVHKVHLLCLVARGRLVDSSCNDPLIQASLLSLLPLNLLKVAEVPRLTANELRPLVDWFGSNFYIKRESIRKGCFKSNLAFALEKHEGTNEEIAALSVALFRALNLTTRLVSNLDVAFLKPDADMIGASSSYPTRLNTKLPSSISTISSPQIRTPDHENLPDSKDESLLMLSNTTNSSLLSKKGNNTTINKNVRHDLAVASILEVEKCPSASQTGDENLNSCAIDATEGLKRKGDIEFELQLAMALSATITTMESQNTDKLPTSSSHMKKMKIAKSGESNPGAIWSRKSGPPLHWAEVYCNGETMTGRWVHVDAANGLVDGEENIEPATAVCKRPLRYAVAFAGNGAKDVTRRYCRQWYKITPQRVNSQWWDAVLAPLKELESSETGSKIHLGEIKYKNFDVMNASYGVHSPTPHFSKITESYVPQRSPDHANVENRVVFEQINVVNNVSPCQKLNLSSRGSFEDMELEIRALTEPLPTNQLAYKNHHLYAIEKWLTKYQILYPKGPVVGFCSGHAVYPRSCVQTLHTRQKWLREGMQIQENEFPAKVLKRSKKAESEEMADTCFTEQDEERSIELFGKWQVELLQLPHPINGIVPKNEYGRVDVWSEKCLPPGTVHLRLPRMVQVARRLEIDFANAMVGFEFRNGRSYPVYEGIVVCTEFRDSIMEAYKEEEERRKVEEKRKNEADALSRWFQLLSSIITRHRLQSSYGSYFAVNSNDHPFVPCGGVADQILETEVRADGLQVDLLPYREHEHVFLAADESLDEGSVRTKRCSCGFTIQVEEL